MNQVLADGTGRAPPPRPVRADEVDHDLVLRPRPSNEITTSIVATSHGPARIRKKQSSTNMRAASDMVNRQGHKQGNWGSARPARDSMAGTRSGGESKQRKGSLRDVVRRIFGRRYKETETKQPSPSRHAYHKSVCSACAVSHLDTTDL